MRTLTRRQLSFYIIIAALSMYTTLFVSYIGEEATYTISSMEMWYFHNYWFVMMFGVHYWRPPFFNWLIIPVAKLIGWQHILIASRFVTASATLITAGLVAWFVNTCTKDRSFTLLSTAIYLSGDLLFRRGWLAYADSTFSMAIMLGIIGLWLALEKKQAGYFLLAILGVCAAFLTKALTAFAFYGFAGLVLLCLHQNRRALFSLPSLISQFFILAFPFIWAGFTSKTYLIGMLGDLGFKQHLLTTQQYLYNIFFYQPTMLIVHFAPLSVVALLFMIARRRINYQAPINDFTKKCFALALVGFIPCWFAHRWPEARYYLPIYPFIAISIAYIIYHTQGVWRRFCWYLLVATLCLKLIAGCWWFYFFQHKYRADFSAVATRIMNITDHHKTVVDSKASTTIYSLVSLINGRRLSEGKAPLLFPKVGTHLPYFIITNTEQSTPGKTIFTLKNRGRPITLKWKD